ncbi:MULTISPECIES: pyrimidine utilization protein D [unclassified Sphingopyxis]|uniref:pyrimidine utilization protein D n=1 Tax=unclassified Sphingopyxis TaxID=2614943 RepID=UPI00073671F6|nr:MULTISPECIES: pyrimidine utilization protein D [unclassified Sphingopyxis]KTE30415.1 pyrimidine utilization protein D [Sphingopyxis sp. HIX]KTE84764.1 pyrimidine utilization protein D [Sphingopyxis sp. HXXIV]
MAEAAGLYYEIHGAEDAPPLILSSGLGGSANYWAPNIAALAEHFRVIAYDHRGTGRSDRALPDIVTLADLGADMIALMDALGVSAANVCGHAIGGMAAIEAARAAPERVDRIAIINGWASLDPQTARCFDVRLTLLRTAGAAAYLEAQPLFLFPPDWLSERDADLRAEAAMQLEHWPGDATMEKRIAAARMFDCRNWAGDIAAPVLLYCASDDLLVPSFNSTRLQALIPQAQGVERGWGGHAVNITDAAAVSADLIDFFRR